MKAIVLPQNGKHFQNSSHELAGSVAGSSVTECLLTRPKMGSQNAIKEKIAVHYMFVLIFKHIFVFDPFYIENKILNIYCGLYLFFSPFCFIIPNDQIQRDLYLLVFKKNKRPCPFLLTAHLLQLWMLLKISEQKFMLCWIN
jgi:hypothetical protein